MKKVLFGTTAAVAFGLAAGSASAAGLELSLSGSVTSGMAIAAYDGTARNSTNAPDGTTHSGRGNTVNPGGLVQLNPGDDTDFLLINDGEVAFKAAGTLDNGLTIGAKSELGLWGKEGDVDESMVYIEGAFGRVELGEEDGAHDQMHNVGAGAGCTAFQCAYDAGGIVWDRANQFTAADFGIDGGDTGDSTKLTYYTPSFSGFKAGVSYIPRFNEANGLPVQTTTGDDDDHWAYEAGISYANSFGDLSYGFGFGYTDIPERADANSFAVSGKIGYNGFSFGGVYEDEADRVQGNTGAGAPRTAVDTGWGVGAGYATGPWNFGVSYGNGDEGDNHGVGLGWDYALGTGVKVGGSFEWAENDDRVNGVGNDESAYGASLLMALSF